MGAACMIGLGLALAQPKKQVLVVTGDGDLLMNVGALATIAVMNPPNLAIVCVDNGHYGETGWQKSHTSLGVDLEKMAIGAGIKRTMTASQEVDLAARRTFHPRGQQRRLCAAARQADRATALQTQLRRRVLPRPVPAGAKGVTTHDVRRGECRRPWQKKKPPLGGDCMKLPRRRFLQLAAGAAMLPAVSRIARAQAYPTRPVRIVVGFTPAGATDILARLIGQWLSERLGQPFVVENRPGAGSNIGTEAVVRAPADGHTLLLVAPANAINATLYDRLNFNFIRDIAPVAGLIRVRQRHGGAIHRFRPRRFPSSSPTPRPIRARSTWPRPAPAAQQHVAGELFKMMAGIDMVHVPYRGGGPR